MNYGFYQIPIPFLFGRGMEVKGKDYAEISSVKSIITERASGLSVCVLLITQKQRREKLSRARSVKFTLDSFSCLGYSLRSKRNVKIAAINLASKRS